MCSCSCHSIINTVVLITVSHLENWFEICKFAFTNDFHLILCKQIITACSSERITMISISISLYRYRDVDMYAQSYPKILYMGAEMCWMKLKCVGGIFTTHQHQDYHTEPSGTDQCEWGNSFKGHYTYFTHHRSHMEYFIARKNHF